MQTLKQKLTKMSAENLMMEAKVQEILMKYRATPLVFGQPPAELYLGRRLRLSLDAIFLKSTKPVAQENTPEKGVRTFQ